MAKIAFRVYNNEITDLIDHGQIDEAVAHCRHILESYPKHVDTYRLLGKAYLEEQRYGDASDILQRVLSSIPEDFISQVGMSIIREDEGNLDTAIFHMERAFEVQPSNHAIQDELKRLQGRRDGIEPPKIRLTRGALARMYAHGNLHDLAIAELLAALSEDPQRYDLMVLLANMYFEADKKGEAAESCRNILDKLPYCLDANRLLVNILESSQRDESAQSNRQRWEELDPYAVALGEGDTNTEFVPNQTITVDRLDWEPGAYDDADYERPAWASSLGVDIKDESGEGGSVPDWLSEGEGQLDQISSQLGETPEDESTHEWMPSPEDGPGKPDFGILPESSKPEEPTPSSEESLEDSLFPSQDEEEGTPDWMTLPTGDSPEPSLETSDDPATATPDWLETPSDSAETQEESPPIPSEGADESTPDWMALAEEESTEGSVESASEEEAIPEFLKDAGWEEGSGEEAAPVSPIGDAESSDDEEITEGELPDWMKDLPPSEDDTAEPAPVEQEDALFMPNLQSEESPEEQDQLDGEEPTETPEWLTQIEGQDKGLPEEIEKLGADEKPLTPSDQPEVKPVEESPEPVEQEGLAWLENLAAKQGIPEEELVTSPEERTETPPEWSLTSEEDEAQPEPEVDTSAETSDEPSMEWLDQLSEEAIDEAASTSPALDEAVDKMPAFFPTEDQEPQPETVDPTPTGETPDVAPASSDEEEGMGWLENLAAKQGIDEEELVTSPEERSDTPPDWLQATDEGLSSTETEAELSDEPSMEWLNQLSQEAAEEAAPGPVSEDTPEGEQEDWLQDLSQPESEAIESIPESIEGEVEEDGLGWLENLAAKQGIDEEELVTSPEERSDTPPDWPQTIDEGESQTETEAETSAEISDEPSLEWLDQLGQETTQETAEEDPPTTEAVESAAGVPEGDDLGWLDDLTDKAAIAEEEPAGSPQDDGEETGEEDPPEWILPEQEEPQAEMSVETPQETESVEEEPSTEWLEALSQEGLPEDESEQKVAISTDWLNEISDLEDDLDTEEQLSSTPDAIDKVEEWVLSLDPPDATDAIDEETVEPKEDEFVVEPGGEIVESMVPEDQLEPEHDSETIASEIMDDPTEIEHDAETIVSEIADDPTEIEHDAETIVSEITDDPTEVEYDAETMVSEVIEEETEIHSETDAEPTLVPEWLQDVAEQKPEPDAIEKPPEWLPEVEEPVASTVEDVAATQPGEWQPESEVQLPPPEETKPAPTRKAPTVETSEALENARQAMSENNFDEAIKTYGTLIKRGKVIDETIEDIQEALRKHPINSSLWHVLGDALMRSDRLQEALDAYSKAEDLLR